MNKINGDIYCSSGFNLDENGNIIPANKKQFKRYILGHEPLIITETYINRPIGQSFNNLKKEIEK